MLYVILAAIFVASLVLIWVSPGGLVRQLAGVPACSSRPDRVLGLRCTTAECPQLFCKVLVALLGGATGSVASAQGLAYYRRNLARRLNSTS
jgi:hypothetical protein